MIRLCIVKAAVSAARFPNRLYADNTELTLQTHEISHLKRSARGANPHCPYKSARNSLLAPLQVAARFNSMSRNRP